MSEVKAISKRPFTIEWSTISMETGGFESRLSSPLLWQKSIFFTYKTPSFFGSIQYLESTMWVCTIYQCGLKPGAFRCCIWHRIVDMVQYTQNHITRSCKAWFLSLFDNMVYGTIAWYLSNIYIDVIWTQRLFRRFSSYPFSFCVCESGTANVKLGLRANVQSTIWMWPSKVWHYLKSEVSRTRIYENWSTFLL